jgi:hypothetical protein
MRNAPTRKGQGVGVSLGSDINAHSPFTLQAQLLVTRFGLRPELAGVVAGHAFAGSKT